LGGFYLLGALFEIRFVATFSAAIVFLLALASWWRWHSLDGVRYERKLYYRRAFPGETVPLTLEIENRKPLPLSWLRVEDPWPMAVGPQDEQMLAPSHLPEYGNLTNVFSLRWFERAHRSYHLQYRSRGVYKVGPARIQSGDVFGIYEQTLEMGSADYLTVFPELAELGLSELPSHDPFGTQSSQRRLFEDPNQPMGVREYRPEDSFKQVHWPATARTGQLQVKVYQPTAARVVMICLNISTFERHWEGVYPELMEALISTSAALVHRYFQEGYQVGLISNGCLAHSDRPFRIPPGRSPKQLGALLEALAGVTPIVMTPFEQFLFQEMPKVHYGASLIVVTAVHTPELFESLSRLRAHGRKMTLVTLSEKPPQEVPGILQVHIPFNAAEENEEPQLR
jgi:uncharacterized protein (DUF58 family)